MYQGFYEFNEFSVIKLKNKGKNTMLLHLVGHFDTKKNAISSVLLIIHYFIVTSEKLSVVVHVSAVKVYLLFNSCSTMPITVGF